MCLSGWRVDKRSAGVCVCVLCLEYACVCESSVEQYEHLLYLGVDVGGGCRQ